MLERGYYNFKAYDDPITKALKTFFYDTDFSVQSTNKEKVKHNFSTRHWQEVVKDGTTTLVFDIHGLNPDDVKVTKESEDGTAYIKVSGTSRNDILDCDMSVNARWAIPYKQFKKPTKKIENALLYIFIEPTVESEDIETI